MIKRSDTRAIQVGNIQIGGQDKVIIQSMTNTKTADIEATLKQINDLIDHGCQLVRLAIFDDLDAAAIKEIKKNCSIPLIADIHFDYRLALTVLENGIDKVRINPGTIQDKDKVRLVVESCRTHQVPIRIGINGGSLPTDILTKYKHPCPQAMIEAAQKNVEILENLDFYDICLSFKSSDPLMCVNAYLLAAKTFNYPLHLGVTEAGGFFTSSVRSSAALGILLNAGIGDTIRVSVTGDPLWEIKIAKELLNCFDLMPNYPQLISCPGCGRLQYDMLAIVPEIEKHLETIKKPLTVAVMGCAVNGPGEAREADIGIAGGKQEALLFKKGEVIRKIKQENILKELIEEIDNLTS